MTAPIMRFIVRFRARFEPVALINDEGAVLVSESGRALAVSQETADKVKELLQ